MKLLTSLRSLHFFLTPTISSQHQYPYDASFLKSFSFQHIDPSYFQDFIPPSSLPHNYRRSSRAPRPRQLPDL